MFLGPAARRRRQLPHRPGKQAQQRLGEDAGLRNADITLDGPQLLGNVAEVQRRQNLEQSMSLVPSKAGKINLDVEMETGTGKTYVYIKTIFEMNKRYGWSKYIVIVPTSPSAKASRRSSHITADHFHRELRQEATVLHLQFQRPARAGEVLFRRRGAGDGDQHPGVQLLGEGQPEDLRRLDDFQSRKPIDVIAANRPIVIIDEPQKIGGAAQRRRCKFDPLFLRYSATHKRTQQSSPTRCARRLTQKLVKKIAVRGINRGLAGSNAYMYLDAIEIWKGSRSRASSWRSDCRAASGDRSSAWSSATTSSTSPAGWTSTATATRSPNRREARQFEFSNGDILPRRAAHRRRDRGRETAESRSARRRAHLDKESQLFAQGLRCCLCSSSTRSASTATTSGRGARRIRPRVRGGVRAAVKTDISRELPVDARGVPCASRGASLFARRIRGYFSIDKRTSRQIDGEAEEERRREGAVRPTSTPTT